MKKPFTRLAILFFSLVSVVHLLRLVFGWEVTVNGLAVPHWASVPGFVITAGLAIMLWQESRE